VTVLPPSGEGKIPDYERAARKAARRYGVDPDVFVAQLRQESGLRPGRTSSAGAQGIAQFIPSTAKAYGVDLHDGRVTDDLDGAARYMADNLKRTGGDYAAALSIYNSGRPDAYKDPAFAGGQTYNYVKTILGGAKPKQPKVKAPARRQGTQTTTTTTPGTDNSGLRRQLVSQFLQHGGVTNPNAVLALAGQYGQAADVPGTTTSTTATRVRAPSAGPSRSTGGSGSRVLELIYNDGGRGYGIKNGQTVDGAQRVRRGLGGARRTTCTSPPARRPLSGSAGSRRAWACTSGRTRTSAASTPCTSPAHTTTRARPMDVSGDPAKMKAFARRVAAYNRTHKLPE
jgi:hypothetical protein